MKEFEPFEIERLGQSDSEGHCGLCPILREACIADRCMWWVKNASATDGFKHDCAVSLIATGLCRESPHRIPDGK